MKRFLIAAVVLSVFSVAHARDHISNYNPDVMDRAPEGATGQGVVYTHRTNAVVISVGAPITRHIQSGNVCRQQQFIPQSGYQHPQQQIPNVLDVGVRAAIGAAIGNQIGGGRGREIATATGAVIGASTAPQYQHQPQYPQGFPQQHCAPSFEQRVVGYPYVAQYQYIQVRGVSARPIQPGDNVEIIIRSVFYPGS